MKKDFIYTAAVYAILVTYLFAGLLVQLIGGVEKWSDVPTYLALLLGPPAVICVPVFFAVRYVRNRLGRSKVTESASLFRPGFFPIFGFVGVLAAAGGGWLSYGKVEEKMARDETARRAADVRKKAEETERRRLTALSPEERAAEATRKREQAAAAAAKAAQEAAAREAAAKAQARKEQQLKEARGMALLGARQLKLAMRDPESFKLRSALLMNDGTVCYNYRAKNSFGAELPGSAVVVKRNNTVELLVKESSQGFVAAWNQRCANKTGEDLTPIIERSM
jgi:flagellar biosynthesis GTPase FlhF